VLDVSVQVTAVDATLLGRGLGVDSQSHTATTSLSGITLARHITAASCKCCAASKLVVAEALSTVFGTSHGVTLRLAVSNALGVANLVVANVGKFDTTQDTASGILVAAIVRPSINVSRGARCRWSRAFSGDGGVDQSCGGNE